MSKRIDLNSSDCQVVEQHVSIVNLDTTDEDCGIPEEKPDQPFLQMVFQDATACKSLLDKIHRSVETYLKTKDKRIRVVTSETGEKVDIFADEFSEAGTIFMVDNKPSIRLRTNEVPSYLPSERSTLHNGELPTRLRLKKAPTCYNCDGNHSLSECVLPRNQERIRKARMQNASFKLERYHTDLEQKFAHIQPGHVSENLRRALGLPKKSLPVFVYRMRLLGYPPGWMEEAKISHSGLNLFDSEGRNVRSDGMEDGEVGEMREQYNPEKIIDFPGFNVDPPAGCIDESQLHGVSPMMEYHRKEVMFKMFGLEESQPGYKRKKLGELEAASPNGDAVTEPQDMEIEDKDESAAPPKQHFALSGNEESSESSKGASQETPRGSNSPSLDELQAAQERLLEALNSNSNEDSKASATAKRPKTPEKSGKSLSMMPGTPILVPFSPFSRIPEGDRWAKGVSGVIDFENLPDSTGKYEKMKNVLEKVRETVSKIHTE